MIPHRCAGAADVQLLDLQKYTSIALPGQRLSVTVDCSWARSGRGAVSQTRPVENAITPRRRRGWQFLDFAPKLLAQNPAVLCDEPHIMLAAAPVGCGHSQDHRRAWWPEIKELIIKLGMSAA